MAGTIIISKGKSFDIRTVDFEDIVQSIRSRQNSNKVAKKILAAIDDFGMDIICVSELNSIEFKEFYSLMSDVRDDFPRAIDVLNYIGMVLQATEADSRFSV